MLYLLCELYHLNCHTKRSYISLITIVHTSDIMSICVSSATLFSKKGFSLVGLGQEQGWILKQEIKLTTFNLGYRPSL